MGITDITLYNIIRKRLGEQETYELVKFIHSEVAAELDTKTHIFLTKTDKAELIDRINAVSQEAKETKAVLIDRINNACASIKSELIIRIDTVSQEAKGTKSALTDRINNVAIEVAKVKSDLIFWMVGLTVLQYLLLMVTKKFF
jgi:hypothetical protein